MNDAEPQRDVAAGPAATTPAGPPAPPPKQAPSRFPVFSFVAFLLLAGGLAYLLMRQEDHARAEEARAAALDAQVAALQADLAALPPPADADADLAPLREAQAALGSELQQGLAVLRDELNAANARIASQAAQLTTLNGELAATNERLRASDVNVDRKWMLAEAQSLLRLAGERLALAADVDAAIALRQAAAQLLEALDEPGLGAAREALTQELQSLQALPRIDTDAIYAELGALAARVDEAAVAADATAVADFSVPEASAEPAPAAGWFDEALASLQQYFVVTKRDEAVTPLLSAEEEYLVRRGIRLKIEEAGLALLQRDPAIYRAALDAAITAIGGELQGADKDRLVAELTALRDTPIVVELPPLGRALDLLGQAAGRAP